MKAACPKLSIIIPCYNGEKYIKKCLDKVLAINLDKEVVVINDGSSDNSLNELKKYGNQIVLINLKKNTGVGNARNLGIDKSKGDCISFVDIDDDFEPNMHEILLKQIIDNNADLCMCNNDFVETNGKRIKSRCKNNYNDLSKMEILRKYLLGEIFPSVCLCVFKAKLVKKIRFNETLHTGEDILFLLRFILNAQKYHFVEEPLYHYVQNEFSTIHSMSTKLLDYMLVPKLLSQNEYNFLSVNCLEEYEYFKLSLLCRSINAISFATNKSNFNDATDIIKKNFKKDDYNLVISNKNTPRHLKYEFLVLRCLGAKTHLKMFPFYRKIRDIKRRET